MTDPDLDARVDETVKQGWRFLLAVPLMLATLVAAAWIYAGDAPGFVFVLLIAAATVQLVLVLYLQWRLWQATEQPDGPVTGRTRR